MASDIKKMKNNRRNYYRILHVQPDAPLEIIRASYRAMMGPLKMHPDMGGNHEVAALINQAWEVLSDPAKRAAYDRKIESNLPKTARKASSNRFTQTTQEKKHTNAPHHRTDCSFNLSVCLFCTTPLPPEIGTETCCRSCGCPLAPPPIPAKMGKELFGRRRLPRMQRSQSVIVHVTQEGGPLPAKLRNISDSGMSLELEAMVREGEVIRVLAHEFEALTQVLAVRWYSQRWIASMRLVSIKFAKRQGVFISTYA